MGIQHFAVTTSLTYSGYLLMRLNVHGNLLRLIKDGGSGEDGYLRPTTYSLPCHHQNDCIKAGSCMSHFNVSLIVWAKSQDGVPKAQFLKRKESRSGSKRGPSVYQPSALSPGHTGSRIAGATRPSLMVQRSQHTAGRLTLSRYSTSRAALNLLAG